MKEVVAGLIKKNNKLLIARRTFPPELNGKWEFPGGKVEKGETPQQGLEREIIEELNMRERQFCVWSVINTHGAYKFAVLLGGVIEIQ